MPILTSEERIGTLLDGKYQLERVLGEGGMGVVFAARHTWTGRAVAIKMLQPGYAADEDLARRFLQEARTATAVHHPNVVDVLDMGSEPDGTVYLALELLEGQTLSALLPRGPLSLRETLGILLPAMNALAVAHDKGFIHRDLKPDNIFLHRQDGEIVPKVLDFGLAKVLQGSSHTTRVGVVMGTPYYIAPEQAAAHRDLGPACDVWAIGVVLYECLSGKLPFVGDTPTAVVLKVCSEAPTPIDQLAKVHPAVAAVVHRALEKQPAVRFANMRMLAAALVEAARAAGEHVVVPRGLLTDSSGSTPLPNESSSPAVQVPVLAVTAPITTPSGAAVAAYQTSPRMSAARPKLLLLGGVASGALLALVGIGVGIGLFLARGDGGAADRPSTDTPVAAGAGPATSEPPSTPQVPAATTETAEAGETPEARGTTETAEPERAAPREPAEQRAEPAERRRTPEAVTPAAQRRRAARHERRRNERQRPSISSEW